MTTTDDLLLRFGRIVRERRDYLGLRQDQVAARGGPSTTTLTKVENGTPPAPTPGTLRKLDVGLGWEQGSATRAVSGGDPTPTHENAIKTEFFSATGKRLGSTIWIEGAEQEFLEQLRMAELTLDAADLVVTCREYPHVDYGERAAAAVRTELAALKLPVPVSVTVDLDTPWDQAPDSPTLGWTANAIDNAVAAAISTTPTPDNLPGTLLERAEAALRR